MGNLAQFLAIDILCQHWRVATGKVHMPLDCVGVIKQLHMVEGKTPQCWKHTDLLQEMWQWIAASGLQFSFAHVCAHQDDMWDWEQLPWSAQLNCECDVMAKGFLRWLRAGGQNALP